MVCYLQLRNIFTSHIFQHYRPLRHYPARTQQVPFCIVPKQTYGPYTNLFFVHQGSSGVKVPSTQRKVSEHLPVVFFLEWKNSYPGINSFCSSRAAQNCEKHFGICKCPSESIIQTIYCLFSRFQLPFFPIPNHFTSKFWLTAPPQKTQSQPSHNDSTFSQQKSYPR